MFLRFIFRYHIKSYDRYWYTDKNFYLSVLFLYFCCTLVSFSSAHRLSPGLPVTLASCPKLASTFTVRMNQGGLVPVLRLLACCPCSTVTLASGCVTLASGSGVPLYH